MMVPSSTASAVEEKLTASAYWPPYRVRERMSRPRVSVPNGYAPPGSCSTAAALFSVGLCGEMIGANTARMTWMITRAKPKVADLDRRMERVVRDSPAHRPVLPLVLSTTMVGAVILSSSGTSGAG